LDILVVMTIRAQISVVSWTCIFKLSRISLGYHWYNEHAVSHTVSCKLGSDENFKNYDL